MNDDDFEIYDVDDEADEYDPKTFRPDKRHTNFHIIFNTNQRENSLHGDEVDVLINKLKNGAVTFAKEHLNNYIVLNEVSFPGILADTPLENRVIERKFEFKVEIGPKKGLIHLHMAIYMSFRALWIQLDSTGAKSCLRQIMGMPSAYFYCKTERAAKENLQDYIRKTLTKFPDHY